MTVLNAVYAKCKILHGNISNRAILLQKTARGVKGILAEFDYANYAGDSAGVDKVPELMLFQSIRCLEDPKAVRMLLDDLESLLYLVCWLDTFGVNQADREANITGLPEDLDLPIMDWNQGTATKIAKAKRRHLATLAAFNDDILFYMRENSPLRPLALDMYRVLFLHPGCYGTTLLTDNYVAEIEDGDIRAALLAIPVINSKRDPLVLRYAFLVAIIANVLGVLARHGNAALAALGAAPANIAGGA
ncbi:hypothetical protein LPJ71_008548 [Coemansia sp. S17]|nr:hypothetical protein LPJ71_008548 [Coemansia sp. S17]